MISLARSGSSGVIALVLDEGLTDPVLAAEAQGRSSPWLPTECKCASKPIVWGIRSNFPRRHQMQSANRR